MIPEHDPLIEMAIRPLSDNEELRQAGAGYLEMLKETRTGGEAEMIRRWELLDRSRPLIRGKTILLVLLAFLTSWVILSDIREVCEFVTGDDWPFKEWKSQEAREQRIAANLNPAEELLMFGARSTLDPMERKAALSRSEPGNPAYLVEYALAHLNAAKPLPADFLTTAKQVDPDNAWFTFLLAAVEAKDCVKVKSRKSMRVSGKRTYSEPISWDIKDRPQLDEALAILRKSRNQDRFETYFSEMLRKRLALLTQQTPREHADAIRYLSDNVQFPGYSTFPIFTAIAARAWLAGEENNEADLRESIQDADWVFKSLLGVEPGTIIEQMINQTYISQVAESITQACMRLNLADEAVKWQQIGQRMNDWKDSQNHQMIVVDGISAPQGVKTGGIRESNSMYLLENYVVDQPPLTDTDVAPARYQDHEWISRGCCYLAWGILAVITSGVALSRFRSPKVIRQLARRMEEQLLPVDCAWMLGLGILLPFLAVIVIIRFTPWGGRDYGIMGSFLLLPAAHFAGLVILWLIVPVQVARWRLGRRLRIFGFGDWNAWAISVAVACGFCFILVIGWAATHSRQASAQMTDIQRFG